MSYEDICKHIEARKEVCVAGTYSRHARIQVGVPVRVFNHLKAGRVRRYVEVHLRSGHTQRTDICRIRSIESVVHGGM